MRGRLAEPFRSRGRRTTCRPTFREPPATTPSAAARVTRRSGDAKATTPSTGDAGHDTLGGGEGDDTLNGGSGNDTLYGNIGEDDLDGGSGNDTIFGGDDDDDIDGGSGNDTIWGGAGNDTIKGGEGDDEIGGGAGNDTIKGGAGNDKIWGSAGDDVLVFQTGHGDDVVHDFGTGNDRIDLSAFSGISGFDNLNVTVDGNDLVIDLSGDGGGSIQLKNFNLDDLDAADFIFHPEPSVGLANADGPSSDGGPGFEIDSRTGTLLSLGQSSLNPDGSTNACSMHGYDDGPDADDPALDLHVEILDDGM